MILQDALKLYNIPYIITDTISGAGFTSYKITPAGSSATLQRLKTRLPDLDAVTGLTWEVITDGSGIYLRSKTSADIYRYTDYNGYIDYKNPDIPFIVGFNNGQIILDTMDAARHMLIAGTTGSGKSVFLHNLITTFACNPHNFLYLVDCKQVEFSIYEGCAAVCSDVFGENSAAVYLNTIINTMESRYADMKQSGVNDFKEYKKLYPDARRYILVIDELSDLIADRKSQKALIPRILRIAQKGRAAGCHVILATQRPDASVINGTLKGNIPTRIAFHTISGVDSRVILDQTGAERLTGNGDGLYLRNGSFNLERVQAPFISLDDIRSIKTA